MWVVRRSSPQGYAPGALELPPPHRSGRAELLELASHLQSQAARLRQVVRPYLGRLQGAIDEIVNLTVRTGDSARFVISLEGGQVLRVGSREGMVFPAHQTSGGLVLLADLSEDELNALFAEERSVDRASERPDLGNLREDVAKVRTSGFAVDMERSERGVVAVGVPVRVRGAVIAGISLAMPSIPYEPE